MARVEVHADRLVIRLTTSEQLLALRRNDIVLDRSAMASAIITDDPYIWIRGVRAPGARFPGKLAIGTWRGSAGRDFVVVRTGRDAVVIDFNAPAEAASEGEAASGAETVEADAVSTDARATDGFDRFARVIISTTHAAELVRALRLDGDSVVVDG